MAAIMVNPPNYIPSEGKYYYSILRNTFEMDTKYMLLKAVDRGAYGMTCSSVDIGSNEKVAIKKINNVFGNSIDVLRTLRKLRLLRLVCHENVIALKNIMMPSKRRNFKDVYLVYKLMDVDLHHVIKLPQPLSNDHVQYFLYQI